MKFIYLLLFSSFAFANAPVLDSELGNSVEALKSETLNLMNEVGSKVAAFKESYPEDQTVNAFANFFEESCTLELEKRLEVLSQYGCLHSDLSKLQENLAETELEALLVPRDWRSRNDENVKRLIKEALSEYLDDSCAYLLSNMDLILENYLNFLVNLADYIEANYMNDPFLSENQMRIEKIIAEIAALIEDYENRDLVSILPYEEVPLFEDFENPDLVTILPYEEVAPKS